MNIGIAWLGSIAGWAWAFIAGGGGLWRLFMRGPWPPTNGWFALLSGVAAGPLVGWSLKKFLGIRVSGWLQFAVAVLFFVGGRVALTIWPQS